MTCLRIQSAHSWYKLCGQVVTASQILFQSMPNLKPGYYDSNCYDPRFEATQVFADKCDKTWIYYHLHNLLLPKAKEVWLNSHPDDSLPGLIDTCDHIYLTEKYRRYLEIEMRTFYSRPWHKVKLVPETEFNQAMGRVEWMDAH